MANYSQAELQYIASQVHPYLLELVRSNGLDVDSIEVVNDTDGITSLPAYDNRGGTKKVVRVPLSTFSKPAQDAADQLAENIASAGEAAAKANEAAAKANAAADEINAVKEDIIQAVEDAQKAVQDSQAALTEVSEKIVEINSSETSRQEAEQSRQNAESARGTEYSSLKNQMESSISEMDVATESALDTANHPTYIGEDNYVYIWDKSNQRYDKTNIYVKGDEGEPGTDGQDPVLTFGTITTLNPGESASASLVSKGVDASGRPVYQLNLSIPRGDKGENGSGSGNVLVSTAGLQSGKTYLFKPNQNESAEGTFVEYEIPEIDTSKLATKEELDGKVDKVEGKQLSTEDFTTLLKQKLDGLSNYDDTSIQESVSKLREDLDTLVSGDTTTAIKTFNEVIDFLAGLEDTEDLSSIIASIEQQIASKQDAIADLETIRQGAALGATAIQEHQDISGLLPKAEASETYQPKGNYATTEQIITKSDGDGTKYLADDGTYKEIAVPEVDFSELATKEELEGKQDKVMIVDHGTDDTTFAIVPNILHKWGTVSSLTITLASPVDTTVANYYMFEFTSGSTATTLSLPSSIKWASDVSIEANKTYQVSIFNGCGIIGGF